MQLIKNWQIQILHSRNTVDEQIFTSYITRCTRKWNVYRKLLIQTVFQRRCEEGWMAHKQVNGMSSNTCKNSSRRRSYTFRKIILRIWKICVCEEWCTENMISNTTTKLLSACPNYAEVVPAHVGCRSIRRVDLEWMAIHRLALKFCSTGLPSNRKFWC